ncbi:unnamed protein product [Periconia digitata]|uniref:Carrier domain-containing protein n=1 Tax=Periconia digitata TaxID=1303443 RepID=A0A9W4U974_9PLEO|nr:unnamed protein product [Periconia digitata]
MAHPGNNFISYFQEYHPSKIPYLKYAWQQVIRSEPIFQSVFDEEFCWDGGMVYFSWTESIHSDKRRFQRELESISAPKTTIPTTEFRVVTLANQKSVLVWQVHYALVNGYSARKLLRKVKAVIDGKQICEGPSFQDLVHGWRIYQTLFRQESTQFWCIYLQDIGKVNADLALPPPERQGPDERPRPGVITFLSPLQQTIQFSKDHDLPLLSVYYAAWALVLSLYTGSNIVMFGVLFANRSLPLPAIRDTVGPMMNTLPLLLSLDRTKTLQDFTQYTAARLSELSEFEWSIPNQHCSMTSALSMQYDYESDAGESSSSFTRIQTGVPISLFLGPKDNIQINYDGNMYTEYDITNLGRMYVHAIDTLVGLGTQTLHEYFQRPLPSKMWQEVMLKGNCFSDSSKGHEQDTLQSLFHGCVRANPNSTAVVRGDASISYAELDAAASKVAATLCEIVRPGNVVCVHADRSINWIIAIYAVIKAHAVYCPMDPALPASLRDSYFQTSRSQLFLTTSEIHKEYKPASAPACHSVEKLLCRKQNTSATTPTKENISKKAPAYLCFTSGSSGLPKGVLCTHEGVVGFQKYYDARMRMRPNLKLAQIMSPAFDGSIHEIFSCFSYGGTLLLSETSDVLDNLNYADVAIITPSVAKLLNPNDYPNLQAIYMVGEHVPQSICDSWAAVMPAFNMYGPTESSCGATRKTMKPGEKITIGVPVLSTRIYILDQDQRPLPPGVIGELYTAGVQVSPGYVNRPDETAKSFLDDTILPELNQKMYRTRDCGYWNTDGEICLLGRSDRQIKLRGFRLDLDDLEIRMARCSSATSVALVRKDDILMAMIVPESANVNDFNKDIRKALPPQALPKFVKSVAKFHLSNSEKLDYKAIAAAFSVDNPTPPTFDRTLTSPSKTNKSSTRDAIISVWRGVLNLDDGHELSNNSSFLDLGGHSLRQIALSNRLSSFMGTRVSPADIMKNDLLGDQIRILSPTLSPSSDNHEPILSGSGGQIESIWRSVLSIDSAEDLHINSNFMELGGDSLLQQKLASRLSTIGHRKIRMLDIINNPRLSDQISLFSKARNTSSIDNGSELGRDALSPIEQDWLDKYSIEKGTSSFNVNLVCDLDRDLDLPRLENAWNNALERHSILRSIFTTNSHRTYA